MEPVLAVFVLLCYAASFVTSVDDMGSHENDNGSGQGHRDLHVLLMTSYSQRFNSSGAEFSVRLALGRVNADASILPGYQLKLTGVKDTKV